MRRIAVITVARSDYGLYRPLLRRLQADESIQLLLLVSGTHLSKEFGLTVEEIEQDGFPIAERIDITMSGDSDAAVAKTMGLALLGFGQALTRTRPDLLVVLGDRSEMMAAALSAVPLGIPIAHLHGGELTEGAIDDALRHALTKLAHLHFPCAQPYAERILRMGEEPWRVKNVGALSVDIVKETELLPVEELRARHGLRVEPPFLLVTYHPVTLELDDLETQLDGLLGALHRSKLPALITAPNADAGGWVIRRRLETYLASHPESQLVENLGSRGYLSAMRAAAAVVGNSSSGLIEAAPMGAPVVNVGTRQEGRLRSPNVIDVGYGEDEIASAIERAMSPTFRAICAKAESPYGDGTAAEQIVNVLKTTPLGDTLLRKRFIDSTPKP